jgi:hypothetical protein
VRQYNLVAVLGRNAAASGKAEAGGSSGSPDNSSASREGLTLGKRALGTSADFHLIIKIDY